MLCREPFSTICNDFTPTSHETSTQTTKIATLASPRGSNYSITGPIFLMIGFIVGFAILCVMLVSIFHQATLKPTLRSRSNHPPRSKTTVHKMTSLKPIAKRHDLLLVPRNDAGQIDSVHPTFITEMPSYDIYKETKN